MTATSLFRFREYRRLARRKKEKKKTNGLGETLSLGHMPLRSCVTNYRDPKRIGSSAVTGHASKLTNGPFDETVANGGKNVNSGKYAAFRIRRIVLSFFPSQSTPRRVVTVF